jgi:hypothetical protein
MAEKRIESTAKLKLVAEFFSNVAVAWFAAGVIGVFVGGVKSLSDAFISLSWGISFSFVFLLIGTGFVRE